MAIDKSKFPKWLTDTENPLTDGNISITPRVMYVTLKQYDVLEEEYAKLFRKEDKNGNA
jgi:hypothetical protein